MKLRAYSIYDRKALQYHPPYFASTDGAAVRMFADVANDGQTQIGRHPGDFVLFFIGEYDDQSGAMEPVGALVHIIDALPLVKAQEPLPFAPRLSPTTIEDKEGAQ